MLLIQTFKKDSIIDLDNEFGVDRPAQFSWKGFVIACGKKPSHTERIACRYGITKDEYGEIDRKLNIASLSLLILVIAIIVMLVIIGALYGQSTITIIIAVISLIITGLAVTAMGYIKKISWGLLFHAMNFDY